MNNLQEIVSKNLIKYRTEANLTQAELAKKLNYSDKSVSKWERGDGLPDLNVLMSLCEIYNITLNDIVGFSNNTKISKPKQIKKHKHSYISLLSSGLVWFVATICYALMFLFPSVSHYAWYSFVYAIPVNGIVLTVFSAKWGNEITNALSSSLILWGLILSVCLSTHFSRIWILCAIGGVFEILIILWFIFRKKFKKNKILERE